MVTVAGSRVAAGVIAPCSSLALLAACTSLFGPGGSCNERDAIEVCADRDEYRYGEVVGFEVTNRRPVTVYEDACARHLATRTSPASDGFDSAYLPSRHCGPDPTPEVRAAHRLPIPAGDTRRDTIRLGISSVQGESRVQVWIVDEDGRLLSESPFASGLFSLLRSTN